MDYLQGISFDITMPALLYLGLLGLFWGDFMGMLVQRTSHHISSIENNEEVSQSGIKLYGGRSACMNCKKQLSWHDNVPLISWLSLKGRSSCCNTKISPIYPVTEVFFMAAFPMAFYYLTPLPAAIFLIALSICYTAMYVDLKVMHIPIEGNYLLLLLSFLVASMYQPSLEDTVLYAIIAWLSIHLFNAISPQQLLGEGDIPIIVSTILISFGYLFNISIVVASVATIAIFIYNLVKHKSYSLARMVPFGPGLSIGYMVALFIVLTEPVFY